MNNWEKIHFLDDLIKFVNFFEMVCWAFSSLNLLHYNRKDFYSDPIGNKVAQF